MSTESFSDVFISPEAKEKMLARTVKLYRDSPLEALQRLATLWKALRGSSNDPSNELIMMVHVAHEIFRDVKVDYPKPEGGIWRACVQVELLVLALQMIMEEGFFKKPLFWTQSVIALNGQLARIWLSYAHPPSQNPELRPYEYSGYIDESKWKPVPDSQADEYFQTIGTVWDTMWNERASLLSDAAGRPNVAMASFTVGFIHAVTSIHLCLYPGHQHELTKTTSSVVGLSLACWTYAATSKFEDAHLDPDEHYVAFVVVKSYMGCVLKMIAAEGLNTKTKSVWRTSIDRAMQGIGAMTFMRACHTALASWPHMVGKNLQYMLEVLDYTSDYRAELGGDPWIHRPTARVPPIRRAFWDLSMSDAVAEALEREYNVTMNPSTSNQTRGIHGSMCMFSCKLLECSREGFTYASERPPIMDGLSTYRILSRCLLLLCCVLESSDMSNSANAGSVVAAFKDTCDATIRTRDRSLMGELQLDHVRRIRQEVIVAAKRSWYTDVCALRSQQSKFHGNQLYNLIVSTWVDFGKALGIEETVERNRRLAADKHLCSWSTCPYHIKRSPTALFACAGCRERNYCSRDCQKQDWKRGGHREKCRRLAA